MGSRVGFRERGGHVWEYYKPKPGYLLYGRLFLKLEMTRGTGVGESRFIPSFIVEPLFCFFKKKRKVYQNVFYCTPFAYETPVGFEVPQWSRNMVIYMEGHVV